MKEDYVSFEIAKLLKEKGFDELSIIFYSLDGNGEITLFDDEPLRNSEIDGYAKVTHQMAMKWLREKYNIHIEIHYLHKSEDYSYVINNVSNGGIMCVNGFDSYENAVEAAILECLTNLIL